MSHYCLGLSIYLVITDAKTPVMVNRIPMLCISSLVTIVPTNTKISPTINASPDMVRDEKSIPVIVPDWS